MLGLVGQDPEHPVLAGGEAGDRRAARRPPPGPAPADPFQPPHRHEPRRWQLAGEQHRVLRRRRRPEPLDHQAPAQAQRRQAQVGHQQGRRGGHRLPPAGVDPCRRHLEVVPQVLAHLVAPFRLRPRHRYTSPRHKMATRSSASRSSSSTGSRVPRASCSTCITSCTRVRISRASGRRQSSRRSQMASGSLRVDEPGLDRAPRGTRPGRRPGPRRRRRGTSCTAAPGAPSRSPGAGCTGRTRRAPPCPRARPRCCAPCGRAGWPRWSSGWRFSHGPQTLPGPGRGPPGRVARPRPSSPARTPAGRRS